MSERRTLSPQEEADLRFRDGMTAFEAAMTAAGDAEDASIDPGLVQRAVASLADAADLLREQNRPLDEAQAHFGIARILQHARARDEAGEEAVGRYRQGLELLDTTAHRETAFEAFLGLGELLCALANRHVGNARDAGLTRAVAALQAAEFLAAALGDADGIARARRATALALGERFTPDRDRNLLDAIAGAEEALPVLRRRSERAPIEHGSLLVMLGNSWLKDGSTPRSRPTPPPGGSPARSDTRGRSCSGPGRCPGPTST
jgi:hypothetical protein